MTWVRPYDSVCISYNLTSGFFFLFVKELLLFMHLLLYICLHFCVFLIYIVTIVVYSCFWRSYFQNWKLIISELRQEKKKNLLFIFSCHNNFCDGFRCEQIWYLSAIFCAYHRMFVSDLKVVYRAIKFDVREESSILYVPQTILLIFI